MALGSPARPPGGSQQRKRHLSQNCREMDEQGGRLVPRTLADSLLSALGAPSLEPSRAHRAPEPELSL